MSIKGYLGKVVIDGGTMGNAKSWSLDINKDTEDTTSLGSNGWKESTPTLTSWSGSITAIFDASGTSEVALHGALVNGSVVALELQVGDGSGALDDYTGNANITSQAITNDVNGIVEVSFDFEGTGVLATP